MSTPTRWLIRSVRRADRWVQVAGGRRLHRYHGRFVSVACLRPMEPYQEVQVHFWASPRGARRRMLEVIRRGDLTADALIEALTGGRP